MPAQDYLALPRPADSWVIEDILPKSGLLNIYGKPKSHKSWLAMQFAAAIGSGQVPDVLGFPIHEYGPVCYLQIDTPRGLWSDRLMEFFPNAPGVFMADPEIAPFPFNVQKEGFHWLKDAVAAVKPVVVVIDTLREAHSGDENDSDHMKEVVASIQSAVRPSACIMLSHARKNMAENFDLMNENRGSGYMSGRMDAIMYLGKEHVLYHSRRVEETRHEIIWTPLVELKDPIGVMATRIVRNYRKKESESQMTERLRARYPQDLTRDAARGRIRTALDKAPR